LAYRQSRMQWERVRRKSEYDRYYYSNAETLPNSQSRDTFAITRGSAVNASQVYEPQEGDKPRTGILANENLQAHLDVANLEVVMSVDDTEGGKYWVGWGGFLRLPAPDNPNTKISSRPAPGYKYTMGDKGHAMDVRPIHYHGGQGFRVYRWRLKHIRIAPDQVLWFFVHCWTETFTSQPNTYFTVSLGAKETQVEPQPTG